MTQHRPLDFGQVIPESWLDALQELISTYVSPNFQLTVAGPATLSVPAGTDVDQVGVSINGRWRYNVAAVTAAHPGGAAGTYSVWVTASDNNFQPDDPEERDLTDYRFGLVILPAGTPPGTTLSRQVGTLAWSGSVILGISQPGQETPSVGQVGAWVGPASTIPAKWLAMDGASKLRADYPTLFALIGTTHGEGSTPGVTFTVPNAADTVLAGVGTSIALAARKGADNHAHSTAAHSHTTSATPDFVARNIGPTGAPAPELYDVHGHTHPVSTQPKTLTDSPAGSSWQPTLGVVYMVRALP